MNPHMNPARLNLRTVLAVVALAAWVLPISAEAARVGPDALDAPDAQALEAPPTATRTESEIPHLRLVRAEPAADGTVTGSPAEIRLFFSEPPLMRGTTVRLADARDNLVASSDAAADAEDARQVWIAPAADLAPGQYTVHWRVIAQDGHTQRGSFSFRVNAAP
jgi:copper resistance protein C